MPLAHVLVRSAGTLLSDQDAADLGIALLRSEIRVRWGDWSLTAAAVEALTTAQRLWDPDHVVLVSGQDHPVTDLAAWESGLVGVDAVLRRDPGTTPAGGGRAGTSCRPRTPSARSGRGWPARRDASPCPPG